eukprot:2517593-Rhodomonas_salina.5
MQHATTLALSCWISRMASANTAFDTPPPSPPAPNHPIICHSTVNITCCFTTSSAHSAKHACY